MNVDHILEAGYVIIEPLHDTLEQPEWLKAASNDLLAYITPILGPTSTLIVHRFAWYFAAGAEWHQIQLDELAATFGVSAGGINSPLVRSVQRIHRFGLGRIEPTSPKLRIRTAIPPISRQMARVIPAYLADDCPYLVR